MGLAGADVNLEGDSCATVKKVGCLPILGVPRSGRQQARITRPLPRRDLHSSRIQNSALFMLTP
jgi:hypothetical protein